MSTSDTKLISTTSNGATDLKNIFQINPNCSTSNITLPFQATGIYSIEYSSGYYIIKWLGNGTFTNISITNYIEVLVVGGGGSGGGGLDVSPYSASGGNGGSLAHVTFIPSPSNVTYSIVVGQGGSSAGGVSSTGHTGNNGGQSQISATDSSLLITVPGGNGGYSGSYWPYGQTNCSITLPGGSTIYYRTPLNTITGGNASQQYAAPNGWSSAGNNGYGVFIPSNSINLQYFGGGGGGAGSFVGGSFAQQNSGNGGLGGGGNGGYSYGVNPYPFVSVGNGKIGTGGGGGGGAYTFDNNNNSGSGGDGTVIIWFKYPN